jgi:phenylacetate-CoA ligase
MNPRPRTTPLDAWIARRIGLARDQDLTPDRLEAYQLERLNTVLAFAARHSPFYRHRWGTTPAQLDHLSQLTRLPFTSAALLRQDPMRLLTLPQRSIARVVTLRTSGTTGDPKRIFFSDDDLARTIDFFEHGMATLVRPSQRVLILLPGQQPDSVGDLLRRALARMKVTGIVHGYVDDPAATVQAIRAQRIDTLVGIPVQVLAMARHPEGLRLPPGTLRGVLLTTDHVPAPLVEAIERAWGCPVFQHYGMTEMGYGGGVSCSAHEGYHLRECDLLFEIIEPLTGIPAGPQRIGEVVFTTLTHRAMPLIRYRTGDLATWIDAPCPCGSVLRRMGWVQGRSDAAIRLGDGIRLTMAELDNALFALPGVVDFRAQLRRNGRTDRLHLTLFTSTDATAELRSDALRALLGIPAIRASKATGALVVAPIDIQTGGGPSAPAAKRTVAVIPNRHSTEEPNP